LLGSLTLEDAVIMSKSSNDLSSGKLTFSSRWLCDVPMLAFGGVIGRMNAEFSFNGDNVFVTFTNPYTGEVLDSGSARGNYSGNVFQLPTSGSTIYEVNRSNGLLQVKSNGTVIEASSCMSRN